MFYKDFLRDRFAQAVAPLVYAKRTEHGIICMDAIVAQVFDIADSMVEEAKRRSSHPRDFDGLNLGDPDEAVL